MARIRDAVRAAVLLTGTVLGSVTAGTVFAQAPTQRSTQLSDGAIRARADALIAKMTPEEKAGQLTILFAIPMVIKPEDSGRLGHVRMVIKLTASLCKSRIL